jgi:hypothetical protein
MCNVRMDMIIAVNGGAQAGLHGEDAHAPAAPSTNYPQQPRNALPGLLS